MIHFKISHLTAIAAVVVASTIPVQAGASPGRRPSDVPQDFVVTPFGYMHPSCVYEIDSNNEKIVGDDTIQHTNGSSRHMPPCAYPTYHGRRAAAETTEEPTINGWIEAGYNNGVGAVQSMNATFYVPPGPDWEFDGQTIYFFPGLEPSTGNEILQPVLAWGQSSAIWGITNWRWSSISGNTQHDSEVQVSAGTQLVTQMQGSGCSGNVCSNWSICFTNFSKCFNTNAQNEALTLIFGGALEVYNVASCVDLPFTLSGVSFTHVSVVTMSGTRIYPSWGGGGGDFGSGGINYWNTTNPSCSYQGINYSDSNNLNLTWVP